MSNQSGYVYLLKNDAMPGIYKIGMTNRTVEERVKELSSSTSVPVPFEVICYISSDDAKATEESLHEEFYEFRISDSREFFRFDDDKLKSVIGSFGSSVLLRMLDEECEFNDVYGDNLEEKLTDIAIQSLDTAPYFTEDSEGKNKYIEGSIFLSLLSECFKRTDHKGIEYVMVPMVLNKVCTVKEYKEMLKRNMDSEMLKLCILNTDLKYDPFNLKDLLED